MTVKPSIRPAVGVRKSENMKLDFLFISMHILLVLLFPGSAGTDYGWGGNLNSHLITSCIRNIHSENY